MLPLLINSKAQSSCLELPKCLCACCLLFEQKHPREGILSPNSALCLTLPEDRFPPSITTNKGLVLDENSAKTITTLQLSATDQDSEASQLQYKVTRQPQLGHLEHVASPGEQGAVGPSEQPNPALEEAFEPQTLTAGKTCPEAAEQNSDCC